MARAARKTWSEQAFAVLGGAWRHAASARLRGGMVAAIGLALLSTARWIDVVFWIAVVLSIASFIHYVRTALIALRGRGISTQR